MEKMATDKVVPSSAFAYIHANALLGSHSNTCRPCQRDDKNVATPTLRPNTCDQKVVWDTVRVVVGGAIPAHSHAPAGPYPSLHPLTPSSHHILKMQVTLEYQLTSYWHPEIIYFPWGSGGPSRASRTCRALGSGRSRLKWRKHKYK